MKITNKEFVNAFYKAHGCRGKRERNDIAPLLPYLLCDIGNNIWCKFVLSKKPKFELRKLATQIKQNYHRFNHDLFGVFNDEYTDAIIKKMDEIEQVGENHLRVMRATIMRTLRGDSVTFEVREMFGALLMYYNMAKCAQDVWGEEYKNHDGKPQENPYLKNLLYYIQAYANEMLRQNGLGEARITEEDDNAIADSAKILQRKLGEWLLQDMQNEEKS